MTIFQTHDFFKVSTINTFTKKTVESINFFFILIEFSFCLQVLAYRKISRASQTPIPLYSFWLFSYQQPPLSELVYNCIFYHDTYITWSERLSLSVYHGVLFSYNAEVQESRINPGLQHGKLIPVSCLALWTESSVTHRAICKYYTSRFQHWITALKISVLQVVTFLLPQSLFHSFISFIFC